MNGPDRLPACLSFRCLLLADLLARPAGAAAAADPNRPLLASMIAGNGAGEGRLPPHLGLGRARCEQLLAAYFPGGEWLATQRSVPDIPEFPDLQKLLRDHRAGKNDSEWWVVDIVATACAGSDHLWQDLGLASRDELTRLMWINFPSLASDNVNDMKWKKFLYRRFCSDEGIYVCPAPSCGQCQDFAKCFGAEV